MAQIRSFGLPLAMFLCAGLSAGAAQPGAAGVAGVQANPSFSRIGGDWRSSPLVVVRGSRPPIAAGALDEGVAPGEEPLGRMLLLLTPSAAQQQALAARLAAVQNPSSPLYHQWLPASEFADAYAVSSTDAAAVSAWLSAQGFQVAALPAGRGWVEFSGTVAQVELAFHAQVHTFNTASGESRAILLADISVPAALQPVIGGLVSLDGALSTPALTSPQPLSVSVSELATETSPIGARALTPQLAAQLLNLSPLTSADITGAGQLIAIASRSNVNAGDIAAFRSVFGLPASQLTVTLDGADPGLTSAQADATFAASWAGAAAPGAKIVMVPAATTGATDGVDLSLAAIIDRQLATTAVAAYSSCEAALSPAHQAFYSAVYRQAAAEGIAVIAAAGDSGAAACSLPGSLAPVHSGYGVNALASTPWNTALGVAGFGASGSGASALAAWSPAAVADPAYAGGGGSSTLYATPAWQPVPPQLQPGAFSSGIANRMLPDLSLPTAIDSTSNPGLAFCLSASGVQGCTLVRSGGSTASASLFAGIAALIAQQYGAQGNLAPHLYALSGHSGIFSDVAEGNAQLTCAAGGPGCDASGEIGYSAAAGYDLATGLGVPDANALVTEWASPQVNGTGATNVALTITPVEPNSIYNPAALITLTCTVTSGTGGAVPTGTVIFFDQSNGQNIGSSTLNSSGVAAVAVEGVFAIGPNQIVAEYGGDVNYAALNSPAVSLTTQASSTTLSVTPSATSASPGQTISATVTVTVGTPPAPNITPPGVVTLFLDGQSVGTAPIVPSAGTFTATFPSVQIPTTVVTSHTLQASYPASTDFATSTSSSITINVSKISTTLSMTPATNTPAGNSSLLVTATVTPLTYASADPSGTVEFTLDGANEGSSNVTPGTPSTATFTIPNVTPGTHTLGGTYNGDNSYSASTASSVTINGTKAATVTTLAASPSPLASATPESFTATVAPQNAVTGTTYTLTGTVSFYDGGTLLGTAAVSADAATISGITLSATAPHTIKAVYSGDANWLGSTSNSLTLAATTLLDYVVLTSNYSVAPPGVSIILIATVTPAVPPLPLAEQNPTGTVVFLNGTTVIGSAPLVPVANSDASTATLVTSTLPSGSDGLTASYGGDATYAAEISNLLNIIVQNFTITPSATNPPTNLTITQGGAGSESFNISGQGGFSSVLQIICTVPTQDDMTCTATPQQITPPATVTFVVQTTKTGTIVQREAAPPLWPRAMGGTALAGLVAFFLLPFGRRARVFSRRCLILLLLLVGLAGSGIGCTSTEGTVAFGTPLGVATIKVTASAYIDNTVVSQSTYFTVNVTP